MPSFKSLPHLKFKKIQKIDGAGERKFYVEVAKDILVADEQLNKTEAIEMLKKYLHHTQLVPENTWSLKTINQISPTLIPKMFRPIKLNDRVVIYEATITTTCDYPAYEILLEPCE